MSLIKRKSQTLIGICCAATILNVDESSLRKGCAGTENLTHVRRGHGKRQRISFVLEEVLELKAEWIEASRKTKKGVLRLVS